MQLSVVISVTAVHLFFFFFATINQICLKKNNEQLYRVTIFFNVYCGIIDLISAITYIFELILMI